MVLQYLIRDTLSHIIDHKSIITIWLLVGLSRCLLEKINLITLNIWGGFLKDSLLTFFEQNNHVDIFCLQEVYDNAQEKISTCDMTLSLDIFNEIAACLPDHDGYFCPVVNTYGLAIFIRKTFNIIQHESILIHENNAYIGRGPTHQRLMQIMTFTNDNQILSVCNIHGLWNGKGKEDSEDRLKQSQHIKNYINQLNNPFILCGDFNLVPNTKSLQLIKDNLNDHIKLNNITSTRTTYYEKDIKYADYIFTSQCIKVLHFEVMKNIVSDHSPLLIEFT